MGQHDLSYRLFFSHVRMVCDLLREMVGEEWVRLIDFSTAERGNASFVSTQRRNRESDIIWKFRRRDTGEPVYVYVLLEFQSRPDRYMPVRLMTYIGLFYESLIAEGKLPPSGLLPQVIPIVIYNGLGVWNGPRDLSELIQCVAEQYMPHLPFKLVQEAAYRTEELETSESPVADLFRLERSRNWKDVLIGVSSLRRHVSPDEPELRRAFETWLIEVIAPRLGLASELLNALTLEEFESMLAERIDMWNRQLEEQSLQRGQQEGQEQGQRQALLLLLEKRFGFVDQGTRDRIAAANGDRLLDWFARFVTAENVTDVFGN